MDNVQDAVKPNQNKGGNGGGNLFESILSSITKESHEALKGQLKPLFKKYGELPLEISRLKRKHETELKALEAKVAETREDLMAQILERIADTSLDPQDVVRALKED